MILLQRLNEWFWIMIRYVIHPKNINQHYSFDILLFNLVYPAFHTNYLSDFNGNQRPKFLL